MKCCYQSLNVPNVKRNSNIVMGCWLQSKLVAIRKCGQVFSQDHSNALNIGDNMMVHSEQGAYMQPLP